MSNEISIARAYTFGTRAIDVTHSNDVSSVYIRILSILIHIKSALRLYIVVISDVPRKIKALLKYAQTRRRHACVSRAEIFLHLDEVLN